jgi:hypothetical protein
MCAVRHLAQDRLQIFKRYKEHGSEAFTDRSRWPVRHANQLSTQVEGLIVRFPARPRGATSHSLSAPAATSMLGQLTRRCRGYSDRPSLRFSNA